VLVLEIHRFDGDNVRGTHVIAHAAVHIARRGRVCVLDQVWDVEAAETLLLRVAVRSDASTGADMAIGLTVPIQGIDHVGLASDRLGGFRDWDRVTVDVGVGVHLLHGRIDAGDHAGADLSSCGHCGNAETLGYVYAEEPHLFSPGWAFLGRSVGSPSKIKADLRRRE